MTHTRDSLTRIANTRAAVGHTSLAAELVAASLALHREAGLAIPLYQQRRVDEINERVSGQLTAAELEEAAERGSALDIDGAVRLASGNQISGAAGAEREPATDGPPGPS